MNIDFLKAEQDVSNAKQEGHLKKNVYHHYVECQPK